MAVIPALGKLSKEVHHQFDNSLSYIEILSQKQRRKGEKEEG